VDRQTNLAVTMRAIRDIGPDERQAVGAKAASLGRMLRLGFRVPDGFALETSAFAALVTTAGLRRQIELLEESLGALKSEHVAKLAADIISRLRRTALPPELAAELVACHGALGGGTEPLACRSSSRVEDSEDLAFPGIFLTVLDIRSLDELRRAVIECYCALFGDKAQKYILRTGFRGMTFATALIVQKQVASAVSGVAFSRSPFDDGRNDSILIEAVPGRGDALMSGAATPWKYRHRPGQDWETTRPPGMTAAAPESSPLKDRQLDRLAAICRELERRWGRPVDMEFAFEAAEDEPYLLQCRPITSSVQAGTAEDTKPGTDVSVGMTCSGGATRGLGVDYESFHGSQDELKDKVVLLLKLTSENYYVLYAAAGIVAEQPDSALNHLSIACRELGVPYIAGVEQARTRYHGRPVALDGARGIVYVPSAPADTPTHASVPLPVPHRVAYLPVVRYGATGPEESLVLCGWIYLIAEALSNTATQEGLRRCLSETLRENLRGWQGGAIEWDPPALSEEELAVLNACVNDFVFTPDAISSMITDILRDVSQESHLEVLGVGRGEDR